MTADAMTIEAQKSMPRPVEWSVECRTCGHDNDVMMSESGDGATYTSGDWMGDPFVTCEVCQALIEPVPVVVTKSTS
ncbi:MAG: hypothetical protein HOO99_03910 [Hyphomicrobiaceae bacterium]|nr:hypothetical protein [Hyphomicrobiaceae bacterium]